MRAVEAAKDVVFGRPANVVANEKIEKAVAVVVKPERGSAQALAAGKTAGARDLNKSAPAGVAEETALSDASDENVRKAIVVVVADRNAHAVHLDIEAGAFGDVGEGAVAIVAVETQRGALSFVTGPVRSVEEQNVLPAVSVVVEKGATGAERFWEQFSAVSAGIVLKPDSRGGSDIGEAKSQV